MNIKLPRTEGFRLRNGKIETANGLVLEIPTILVENAIDGGANGEVFLGEDLLDRKVAIKVWKTYATPRGFERAKEEVHKLATLKDHGRLFAHVYLFGALPVPEQPEQRIAYAVLEYIDGISGKAWLKSGPEFKARYAVWKLIRTALLIIYREGILHGDPHLGNVIVLTDTKAHYKAYLPAGLGIQYNNTPWDISHLVTLPSLGVKLIDLGSSLLWNNQTNFVARECKIIGENFVKLFPDIGGPGVDKRAIGSNPGLILEAFDVWLEYSMKVDAAMKDLLWAHWRDERSYDELLPLEREVQGLLFARPLVSASVLKEHMRQLGFDYAKLFGEEFESMQDEYLTTVGAI